MVLTRGKRPRRRVHVDARVGATLQAGRWRAHGYSGALVTWGDGNAIRKGASLFKRDLS